MHPEPLARAVRGRELRRTRAEKDAVPATVMVHGAQNLEGSLDGGKVAILRGGGVEVHEPARNLAHSVSESRTVCWAAPQFRAFQLASGSRTYAYSSRVRSSGDFTCYLRWGRSVERICSN